MDYIIKTSKSNMGIMYSALMQYKAYEHEEDGIPGKPNALAMDIAGAKEKIRGHTVIGSGEKNIRIVMADDELRATQRALIHKHNKDTVDFGGMTPAGYALIDISNAKSTEVKERKLLWGIRKPR